MRHSGIERSLWKLIQESSFSSLKSGSIKRSAKSLKRNHSISVGSIYGLFYWLEINSGWVIGWIHLGPLWSPLPCTICWSDRESRIETHWNCGSVFHDHKWVSIEQWWTILTSHFWIDSLDSNTVRYWKEWISGRSLYYWNSLIIAGWKWSVDYWWRVSQRWSGRSNQKDYQRDWSSSGWMCRIYTGYSIPCILCPVDC